jgi:CobW/HypB/UreG, nucleotide-binding domain
LDRRRNFLPKHAEAFLVGNGPGHNCGGENPRNNVEWFSGSWYDFDLLNVIWALLVILILYRRRIGRSDPSDFKLEPLIWDYHYFLNINGHLNMCTRDRVTLVGDRRYLWFFAGKTTLLRNVLENSSLKIGCIVNDVANVNIDAKLIRNDRNRDRTNQKNSTADLADTIELANGCACTPCR